MHAHLHQHSDLFSQILFWDAFPLFHLLLTCPLYIYKGLCLNVSLFVMLSLLVLCTSTHLFITELSYHFLIICMLLLYQASIEPGRQ